MSNVIKFQAPFERIKSYNLCPEVALRKAIITQAIIDASNISEARASKKLEMEAKAWIFGDGEYFREICLGAGIEPSFVVKITKGIIKLHKKQASFKKPKQSHCEVEMRGVMCHPAT